MIYFIRSNHQYIKIGTAVDVSSRRKSLQTGSPVKLKVKAVLPGSYETERGLHEMFSHIRHNGEWFRYTDEMKWFLRAIQENPSETNIRTLQIQSLQMRLKDKAKRLGKDHDLSQRLERIKVA